MPKVCQKYICNINEIYQKYTWDKHVIYLSYTIDIPGTYLRDIVTHFKTYKYKDCELLSQWVSEIIECRAAASQLKNREKFQNGIILDLVTSNDWLWLGMICYDHKLPVND